MRTLQTELPKFTHHNELRRRVILDCSEPKLTDQSFKNMCDINNIIAHYNKTGMFQHVSKITPTFKDNTTISSLEDSFNFVNEALNQFNSLPPAIRKLMDNNPANLDSFICNPDNAEILYKYGLTTERKAQELPKTTDKLTTEVTNGTTHPMPNSGS